MEFKAKPVFIDWKREFTGKHGTIHVFNMTVEKETGETLEGIFRTTKRDQTKFKLNDTVLMKTKEAEEDHEKVVLFDKVSESRTTGGAGSKEKDRAIAANVSILCAARLLSNNKQVAENVKDDLNGFLTVANKIYEWLDEHHKKGVQDAINAQAQIKIVSEYFHLLPQLDLLSTTSAIKYTEKLIEWVNMKMKG